MPPTPPDTGRRAGPTRWRDPVAVALAVATAATFALRAVLARAVVGPFTYSDELGYVAVGRALVGDPPALFGPDYAAGYGTVLAPLVAVLEPGRLHGAAQLLNAAAGAALVPVLFLVATRIAGLGRWLAVAVAVVASSGAALVVQSTMLLPEALFALCTATSVLALHALLRRPATPVAVASGALAGLAYALHTRGASLVVALVAAVAVAVMLRRLALRPAAIATAAAVVPVVAATALRAWANDRLYPIAVIGKDVGTLRALVDEPLAVAQVGAGHLWYPVFATLGMAGLGVAVALRFMRDDVRSARGITAAFVVVGLAGAAVLSGVAMHQTALVDPDRADKVVYGRYLEQWVPVLVVLAPALARRWRWRSVAAVATFSLGVAWMVDAAYPDSTWAQPVAWHNIAALRVVPVWFERLDVLRPAVVVAVVVALVYPSVARPGRSAAWLVPLAAVLVVNLAGAVDTIDGWADPASEHWSATHDLGPLLESVDETVAVDVSDPELALYAYNLQFWHPDIDLDLEVGATDTTSSPFRIARSTSPPGDAGATLVGVEAGTDLGLWALDPAVASRALAAG